MTKVSAIIPAYNRAHCIERAIQSARNQSFKDMEIIVVDDASTDNTADIIKSVNDERIRYVYCQSNRGPGGARNEGLKVARGEYIAFLDSDDEWMPDKIEKQLELMESLSGDWGMCHTGARIIKDGETETLFRPDEKKSGRCLHLFACGKIPYLTPTVMLRKSVVDKVGLFDDRFIRLEDSELFLRVLIDFNLAVMPEPLAVVHMDRSKQFVRQVEQAQLLIIEKHEATIRNLLGRRYARFFRSDHYMYIAYSYFNGGNTVAGTRWFAKAIATYPFHSPKRSFKMALVMLRSLGRKQ